MMAGQLVSSEEAPALSAEDVPDAPVFWRRHHYGGRR